MPDMTNPLESFREILKSDDGGIGAITDRIINNLFSNNLRTIIGTSNQREEDRPYCIGLPIIHELIIKKYVIDDDYIDRNEAIIKMIITSTIARDGLGRSQIVDMAKSTTNVLTLSEMEKDKKSLR